MRKYLFSGAMFGAVFGLTGLILNTLRGPRNLSLLVGWIGGLAGLAAAVLSVRENAQETAEYYQLREAERAQKRR